jgi:hypothetical protein
MVPTGVFSARGLVVLALLVVAACSGGGSRAVPPGAVGPIGGTGVASGASGPAHATLHLTIPAATAAASLRRAKYVSAATQSITIAQTGGPTSTVSLAAGSPNCTSASSGSRTCTLTFGVTAGANQLFAVKAFASTDGSGTPLSAQNLSATIVAGTANTINITLDGVVASLAVFLENPTLTSGQAGTTSVVVNALDASGYVIVTPGAFADANGNPITVTLADSDTTGATKLAQTAVTQPATIALTYTGATIPSVSISATAASLTMVATTLSIVAPGAVFNADQVNAALASTQSYYQTMPHTDVVSDLNALAAEMVSSKAYATAVVSPGGISATLPDGTKTFVFADQPEDLAGGPTAASSAQSAASTRQTQGETAPQDAPSPHQVVILVNTVDTVAFHAGNQAQFGIAFAHEGFAPPNGGVIVASILLENIINSDPSKIDFLNLATHGGVANWPSIPPFYVMESNTPVTAANNVEYATDIAAGMLIPSAVVVKIPLVAPPSHYLFTMPFVVKYMHFNPGAIVIASGCFGQSPTLGTNVTAALQNAGVGRYFGWSKSVETDDSDGTTSFLLDRLLGEDDITPTGLANFAPQRTPAQRAFPLDDVETALLATQRSGAFGDRAYTFGVSDYGFTENTTEAPLADGTAAHYVISDFGGENVANPPAEYALPSIATMDVAEASSGGTLNIHGRFPGPQGTVVITGTGSPVTLPVTSWSTSLVTATLPAGGNGSAGDVAVVSADGVSSSEVPLTQWSGTLVFDESDSIPNLGGKTGSGSGNVEIDYNVNFRSDVHPTVPVIETTPAPQNFTFTNVQGNSTAQWTQYGGAFVSDDGKSSATISLAPNSPLMTPALPPLSPGTFEVRAFTEGMQPSPCNSGLPGVQGAPGNVLCPITGAYDTNIVQCSDTGQDPVCQQPSVTDVLSSYGAPIDAGGLLTMTMGANYTVTVVGTTSNYESDLFFGSESLGGRPATATMTGTIGAPSYAPTFAVPPTTIAAARKPYVAPAYKARLQ